MKAPSIASRILLVIVAVLLLASSATLAWGVVLDYQARGLVPKGVSVVGHDLSGMSETQARSVIEEAVTTPMLRPVSLTGDNKAWTFNPVGIVNIDVDKMIDAAYSPRRSATFVERLDSQLTGRPLPADIKPMYAIDTSAVAVWVSQAAAQVDRKPVDSTRKIVKYAFKVTPEVYGAKLNQHSSVDQIAEVLNANAALSSADRAVRLPVSVIKPKVLQTSFKTGIIVSLAKCRIYLYNGAKLVKTYPCAPGRPGFPTPTGDFVVDSKQRFASWINPGTAWAATMPAVIGPGPSNPMGTTKIGINYGGVFMHGIPPGEFGSIGSHASHGCMRMFPSDVLDLYGRVKLGDPVYIRDY